MALFNKLFTRSANSKHQDDVSEKYFAFNKDQVRVVLFKECDFRGRKLLFDSKSVKKVLLNFTKTGDIVKTSENEKISEISNGYGYIYSKPEPDFNQLSEMVFGSVAMSFRGTYFKMHSLESPSRLMVSQVFSSPRSSNRVSLSSRSDSHTFEHSKLDDSGASSMNSMSEHLSVHSTASDTVLVCRRLPRSSAPLDVPSTCPPSLVGCDSGYSDLRVGSWGASSASSLCRRRLRRSSASLNGSAPSCVLQEAGHRGAGRLGLALVLRLTEGQEEELGRFLMEHVALLEAVLWRARHAAEGACARGGHQFAPLMWEACEATAQYLVSLLSGGRLTANLWLSLSAGSCDARRGQFVREFCELLESADVKGTNFFVSTLLTAVLTYHLGWVNTCLPAADSQSKCPFNPLWGEMSDLYGAVGHPTKMAQTIVTGSNKRELISRILVSMTYFIRCCEVDRRVPVRADVEKENATVDSICKKYSCIPKESYKKYEDHLREIMNSNKDFLECNNGLKSSAIKCGGLARTKTCTGNLQVLASDSALEPTPEESMKQKSEDVVFVLGDDDKLVGLKKVRPSFLDLSKSMFKDSDFVENDKNLVQPSTSWSSLADKDSKMFSRSQSEPPESRKPEDTKNKSKFRYSGVKFNLQQYPQILSNYMKSQNLAISNLHFGDKGLKMEELSSLSDTIISKYPELDTDYDEVEPLQTPSNASELEFDTFAAPPTPNTTKTQEGVHKMKVAVLPMPKSKFCKPRGHQIGYTSSLMRAASDSYMPDMVLQGTIVPKHDWEPKLRRDLSLASQHSLIDQPVEEAVAVVANTDTWEVQLMSSHTFIIDKGSSGIRIGMSQLVANMLESLLQMWKLNVPPYFCLMFIEQTLQELFLRSKALAELLLASEFCSMEQLTNTLHLEVNDVPLLLAVASTHSPQVTQKYGLSFQ